MRRVELLRKGPRLVRTMVVRVGSLVKHLEQRTTKRHIHLLHAAADREYRHPALESSANQGKSDRVALPIVEPQLRRDGLAVTRRMDVGEAAGQQHAVHMIEQLERIADVL